MTTEEKQKEPFEGDAKKIYEIVRGEKAFVAKYLLMLVHDHIDRLSTVN